MEFQNAIVLLKRLMKATMKAGTTVTIAALYSLLLPHNYYVDVFTVRRQSKLNLQTVAVHEEKLLGSYDGKLGNEMSNTNKNIRSLLRSRIGSEEEEKNKYGCFDPLGYSEQQFDSKIENDNFGLMTKKNISPMVAFAVAVMSAVPEEASAAGGSVKLLNSGDFNPDNFKPVCPTSDGLYRFLQGTTQSLVGDENFVEYGPLIAGGLLRIRLELCVVESFFNEAVGPFIEKEGVGWILPLHETVETFLAGTIFALASTFILVGSTKIVSVIVTYGDVFIGAPCRLFGGFTFDRALGRPVTLDIGFGPFKKRIIGPGDAKESKQEESSFEAYMEDLQKIESKDIPIVALSGFLKVYGEGSKVNKKLYIYIIIYPSI